MAASNSRARGLGFDTPASTDLIRNGDNAISKNARAAVDLFDVAITTYDNLTATATALPPGATPTVTVTGPIPNKVINIGVPRGEPGMGYEEGQQLLAQNAATLTAAQTAATDADTAATRAEGAEAAKLEIPDANTAAMIGNPATDTNQALRNREAWVNVHDFGAVGNGVTNDTAAIQAAITSGAGTIALLPGRTYRVDALTLGLRQRIDLPAGARVRRAADSTETGPMVLINRHHGKITGSGVIECLNACPQGIVRVEREGGACEWTRLEGFHIIGPGAAVTDSKAVVHSGFSTFQNFTSGLIINGVETGVYSGPGANMNHYTDLALYGIGKTVFHFDGTFESAVTSGSVHSSADTTVFKMADATEVRVTGFVAEPSGASARFYDLDAECVGNSFVGCVTNTAALGTDNGVGTTLITARSFRMNGGARFTKMLAGSAALTFDQIPARSSIERVIAVPGAAVGDDATAHANSATAHPWWAVAQAIVTGADEVTLRLVNITDSARNTPNSTWRVRVWR